MTTRMSGVLGGAADAGLRRMRWWDIEPVHELEAELFPDPWSVETFWSELAHVPESRHYLVAEDAGAETLLGYAGLVVVGHQADVQTLAVAPSAQGRGLGRRLLDALIAEAARRGAREVLLDVRADNVAAQALYAGAGFERIAIRRGYYRPGGTDALVLRRRF